MPTRDELEAASCWEADDRVPGRPAMTAFRQTSRLHAARWREANGHPIGTQPLAPKPGKPSRDVGSRLPLDYALETGATFVTEAAHEAAIARGARKEPHQSLDVRRTWADLLWRQALAYNLVAGVDGRTVGVWWPDVPGTVGEVRFDHSPGWLDPDFLGNLISFDAAVTLDLDEGGLGVLAIETPFHDRAKREVAKPARLARYRRVMESSGVFVPGAVDAVNGTDLTVLWLQHLLVLSMLQHPSGAWSWGRLVVVHPAGNIDQADLCARYREVLTDDATFASTTLEDLVATEALPAATTKALRERYLPT